jgi:hypothetical protein
MGGEIAIVVGEVRHGINSSFVDILVKGIVISARIQNLKVINEDR